MLTRYLVIGYGNTLRSDDGVGYQIAETVARWNLAHVRSLPLHQLTPDLAAVIANVNLVIFVDASAKPITNMQIEPLQPEATISFSGHAADPRSLLALTQTLYESTPLAYQILIPATNFAFGETLSVATQAHARCALETIKQLVRDSSPLLEPTPH